MIMLKIKVDPMILICQWIIYDVLLIIFLECLLCLHFLPGKEVFGTVDEDVAAGDDLINDKNEKQDLVSNSGLDN